MVVVVTVLMITMGMTIVMIRMTMRRVTVMVMMMGCTPSICQHHWQRGSSGRRGTSTRLAMPRTTASRGIPQHFSFTRSFSTACSGGV
jgi:hypothetical protein